MDVDGGLYVDIHRCMQLLVPAAWDGLSLLSGNLALCTISRTLRMLDKKSPRKFLAGNITSFDVITESSPSVVTAF